MPESAAGAVPPEVPASHADLVTTPSTAVFSTVDAQHRPQSTAVWFLVEDGQLKTSVLTSRQKYRNLQKNPACTLFVLDPANPTRYLEVRASAELEPDPGRRMLALFADRYGIAVEILESLPGERVILTLRIWHVVANG